MSPSWNLLKANSCSKSGKTAEIACRSESLKKQTSHIIATTCQR